MYEVLIAANVLQLAVNELKCSVDIYLLIFLSKEEEVLCDSDKLFCGSTRCAVAVIKLDRLDVEFIKRFYKEEMVDEKEFMCVVNALKEIAYTENHLSALVKFLVYALEIQGFGLKLDGCFYCEDEIEGRTFFDYRNGAFICEKCFDSVGREINGITLSALIQAKDASLTDEHQGTKKALKLLEYYVNNRLEESLNSLKELNGILN